MRHLFNCFVKNILKYVEYLYDTYFNCILEIFIKHAEYICHLFKITGHLQITL